METANEPSRASASAAVPSHVALRRRPSFLVATVPRIYRGATSKAKGGPPMRKWIAQIQSWLKGGKPKS